MAYTPFLTAQVGRFSPCNDLGKRSLELKWLELGTDQHDGHRAGEKRVP